MYKPVENLWKGCGKVLVQPVWSRPQLVLRRQNHSQQPWKTTTFTHNSPQLFTHILHTPTQPIHLCLFTTYPHYPQGLLLQSLKEN